MKKIIITLFCLLMLLACSKKEETFTQTTMQPSVENEETVQTEISEPDKTYVWVKEPTMLLEGILDFDHLQAKAMGAYRYFDTAYSYPAEYVYVLEGYPLSALKNTAELGDSSVADEYSDNAIIVMSQGLFSFYDYDGNALLNNVEVDSYLVMDEKYRDVETSWIYYTDKEENFINLFFDLFIDSNQINNNNNPLVSEDFHKITIVGGLGGAYPVAKLEDVDGQLYEEVEFTNSRDICQPGVISYAKKTNYFYDADGKRLKEAVGDVDTSKAITNGFYVVKNETGYAYVNLKSNQLITDYIYEDVKSFEDGYAPVKRNGKWAYIDTNGKEVIEPSFDDVSILYQGNAYVGIDGQYGILNIEETIKLNELSSNDITNEFSKYTATIPKKIDAIIRIVYVTDDSLRIRETPSTSGEIIDHTTPGEYFVLEEVENDGYTWFRIGKDKWIAYVEDVFYDLY